MFSSIVTSSVWCEDDATVRVWIAMLATADADGHVEGSVPGFANLARVTVDQMRAAVVTLSSPDPESRTPDFQGRRIEVVEGGWRVLNYAAYRERGQAKEGSRAPYFRQYRKRRRKEAEDAERNIPATPPATNDVARNPEERSEKRETDTPPTPPENGGAVVDDHGGVSRAWAHSAARQLSAWLDENGRPGELLGQARARWAKGQGIRIPSPQWLAITRALGDLDDGQVREGGQDREGQALASSGGRP